MNLRDIDLNLLLIFNQILVERSASAAADKLGVSQPAISNALKRLRALLNDELFLRTSRGMEPTPFAQHLAEPVASALNTLQNALSKRDSFDPMTSQRIFRLAMTDIGEMYFMPTLMNAVATRAPHIQLRTLRPDAANLKEDMEDGSIDVALGLFPNLQSGFFQRRLFRHRYVCLYRRGHPTIRSPLTQEQFYGLDHVGVLASNTGHKIVDEVLEKGNRKRKLQLVVPHFIAVGHILSTTDLVATVPERFAERCKAPFDLVAQPHPVRLPEIPIHLFWHAKYNQDPGNLWLRQMLVELFADHKS